MSLEIKEALIDLIFEQLKMSGVTLVFGLQLTSIYQKICIFYCSTVAPDSFLSPWQSGIEVLSSAEEIP